MRAFALIIVAGACQAAAPVITDVVIESFTHSSAQLRFTVNEPGAATKSRVDYGPTPELGFQSVTMNGGSATDTMRGINIGGLAPATKYYFRPVASDNNGAFNTTWTCPDAGTFPGYTCEAAGLLPYFTTEPLPSQHPAPPTPPQAPDLAMPVIDGQTFTVSVDSDNHCTDLATQLAACATSDPSLNHEVVIPAGASCVGMYTLPAKRGAGVCVVRPSTDYSLLPPEGTRINPDYLPLMATIEAPAGTAMGQANGKEALSSGYAACPSPPCTEGWRFVGIHFTHEPHTALKPTLLNIVGIEGNVLTLDGNHDLEWSSQIQVADVAGLDGINGTRNAGRSGPNKIYLYGATPTGTWVNGTGYILRTVSVPIVDASNTNPVVLTTAFRHGLMDSKAFSIVSANGPVLTLSASNAIPAPRAVEIAGSAVAAYNGIWTVTAANGNTVTLDHGPAETVCAAECGSILEKRAIQVFGVNGNTAANGSKLFRVLSPTTLQLDQTAGNGDYTDGGYLSFDPDRYLSLLSFTENAARVILDRCYLEGKGFPDRLGIAVMLYSEASAIINSHIQGINSWRGINPQSHMYDAGNAGGFAATSAAIYMGRGSRKVIANNFITDTPGITLFADIPGQRPIEDITITRNAVIRSDKYRAGSDISDGRWYGNRHFIEFKQGRRIKIEGNLLDGNWADYVPMGPAILLSPRGVQGMYANTISDVDISNNVFRNVSTGIQVEGSDNLKNASTGTTARVRIANNLVYDLDFYRMRSTPSGIGGINPSGAFGGSFLYSDWPVEDVEVTHNTVYDNRGKAPAILTYDMGRGESVTIRNNIFTQNYDYTYGGIPRRGTSVSPPVKGTAKQAFDELFTWAPSADPTSAFAYNVVLPGVKNSSDASNYSNPSLALNFTTKECVDFYAGFTRITCVGAGLAGETAEQRFALAGFVDVPHRQFRLREDSPFKSGGPAAASDGRDMGADIDQIDAAMGKVSNVREIDITNSSATIAYLAPDKAACQIEYGKNSDLLERTRTADGGGGRPRAVSLQNLTSGTVYYYRILCASDQPKGSFVTMP
jgi:hypothetical protein